MLPRLSTYSPGAGDVEHTSYSCFAHQPRPCQACFCSLLYCSPKSVYSGLSLVTPRVHLIYPCSSSCTTKKSLVLPKCCVNIFMTGGGRQEGWKGKGGRQEKSKCRLSNSILMLVTNTSKAICTLTQNQSKNEGTSVYDIWHTVGSSLMGLGCVWLGGMMIWKITGLHCTGMTRHLWTWLQVMLWSQ